ncbi:amidohydrolase family protein [Streptomyces sp. RB6PN25]|uniref:Amidohydrolase family protein n=1 Tax=Streptomyces humicola TaxID=2953240 RepID=A0ABT1PQ21_9ACTN|nr:amidohydrolase family protein [Streptomyces humicola]MCQ4079766.1 amidohydrolase family protein [Streptomyces humicola]
MNKVLIIADRVITGPKAQVTDDDAVLVDAGVISAVGTAAELDASVDGAVPRLRCPGTTVMPGLIDCHVHLAFDAGPDPITAVAQADLEDLGAAMAERAERFLASGVTTVRDLGDRDGLAVALRTSIERGAAAGPRILSATAPLTSHGGHCGFLGGEVTTDDDIRTQIARNAANGADLIKVMASGGALTPSGPRMWESQFSPRQLRLIVDEAARHGLGVAAHAHGTDAITHCVAAGVRTIEHCSWRTAEGVTYDPEITHRMVEDGIAVCRCISGDWRLFLRQLGPERADAMVDVIQQMREAGVRFIAGTDAGVPGARFGDYVGMLEFFQSLGFSHAEIIDMATTNSAYALGLNDTGSLSPGKRADLIVIDGDPLRHLDALRRVRHVFTAGRPVCVGEPHESAARAGARVGE